MKFIYLCVLVRVSVFICGLRAGVLACMCGHSAAAATVAVATSGAVVVHKANRGIGENKQNERGN